MAPDLFLGVEGGATRTTGALIDGDLRVIAECDGGPSNVHAVGEVQALDVVRRIVGGLREAAADRWQAVRAAAFCMAGLRTRADRAVWQRIADQAGVPGPVFLAHDALASLAAGSPRLSGILIVSGTGSVVYGRTADGRDHRVGGRGPILGDEGSGFDIGRRALRAAARAADGRGPATALETVIPKRLGLDAVDDLVPWLSPFAKDGVAGLAPIVFEAASDGDAVARDILDDAARRLACGVEAVVGRLWPGEGSEGPPRVVFSGGVLRAQPGFRQALTDMIAPAVRGAEHVVPEMSGGVGAARVALLASKDPGALRSGGGDLQG